MQFPRGRQQAPTYQRGRKQLAAALKKSPQSVDVLARFDRYAPDFWDGLAGVYDVEILWPAVMDVLARAINARPPTLVERDRSRQLQPDWFQLPQTVGYVAYTDHFAGDLNGIATKIDYLNELGITYLHLMPLLRPRTGENDGGYAVADYKSVRPDLGTIDDLESLATSLHANGIALTLDLVLNHVAEQHEWAVKARNGEEKYRNYFLMYPDRIVPDQYE
ncbi:MAG: alpha-amylase, partial [Actinobacteria bacterium]|nr:alpha-amylase [Actinomycetota bacterium]